MSDEDKDKVVTGEDAVIEQSDNDAPAESEVTPTPGESDEVKGLKAAASANRHKWQEADAKRKIAEDELTRLKATPAKTDDFDPFDQDSINRVVDSRMAEATAQQSQVEAGKQWDKRIEEGQKTHADVNINEIIQDESFYPYISDTMAEVIRGSDDGIDVMLHLNANRDELHQLAQLSPVQAAQQMGVISARLKANAKAEGDSHISNAPDPITPVSSRSVSQKSRDDMSQSEYEKDALERRGGSHFVSQG